MKSTQLPNFSSIVVFLGKSFVVVIIAVNLCIALAPFLIAMTAIWSWLYPLLPSDVLGYLSAVYNGTADEGKTAYKITKNILELANFLSGPLLWLTAVVAFIVTYRQLSEVKKSRLAAVYTSLAEQWISAEIADSREAIRKLIIDIEGTGVKITDHNFPDIFDMTLRIQARKKPENYIKAIRIVDFLEYVGVMEQNGYLDFQPLIPLIGEVTLFVYDIFRTHITIIQQSSKQNAKSHGLHNVPETYVYFMSLTRKFQNRFR